MDMQNNSMVDRVNERFRRTLTGMPASVDLSAAKNAAEYVVELCLMNQIDNCLLLWA